MWNIMRLCLRILMFIAASLPAAQEGDPYKSKPSDHGKNKVLAAAAHKANLKKHANTAGVFDARGGRELGRRRQLPPALPKPAFAQPGRLGFARYQGSRRLRLLPREQHGRRRHERGDRARGSPQLRSIRTFWSLRVRVISSRIDHNCMTPYDKLASR